ncbi:hypothetical protein [Roseibacillus ishigakijimensis]|uniref:SLA1 homology domain-containing protein n=1 Tax=Roseibacillus ishigakijimensis TaxID=454146 RepID=A0A934RUU7_9BACT|nr:hypothetical protein [Roseibacillus ishigakijimensis]MBK1834891.1 hypothetical protein [Roseibacillus ishigakijimensis]
MRRLTGILLGALALTTSLEARTWTAVDGRTLEGEYLRAEGEEAVWVEVGGREVRIALSQLSEGDREFVASKREEAQSASLTLFGQKLTPGKAVEVTTGLPEEVQRELRDNKLPPTQAKVKVHLPENFDPAQPQKVFWPVGGINNEKERLSGNLSRFSACGEAIRRGWIVIAADTEHGNPRETTIKIQEGDAAFHAFVIAELASIWPDFLSWKHACGGHSSGAKGSFFRLGHLGEAGCQVTGIFLSGCNQAFGKESLDESGARKSAFKTTKAFISSGDADNLVDDDDREELVDGVGDMGIRAVRDEVFSGGHSINNSHFEAALKWFEEGAE